MRDCGLRTELPPRSRLKQTAGSVADNPNHIVESHAEEACAHFIFDLDPMLQIEMTLHDLRAGNVSGTRGGQRPRCLQVRQFFPFLVTDDEIVVKVEEETRHVGRNARKKNRFRRLFYSCFRTRGPIP